MIDTALKFLRDYLNTQLLPGNLVVMGNITKSDDITPDKIHLSLIHVEEERILKEVKHLRKVNIADNFYTAINPEIRLNLYILITYQYNGKNYEEALKQISRVATVLQGKYVFNKPDFTKQEYEPLDQIVIELYTQTIDQNSNMWQALGEKLSPSILYKLRVIGIQADRALDTTGEVKAIGVDVQHKPFTITES
jgi:hypothetical protein